MIAVLRTLIGYIKRTVLGAPPVYYEDRTRNKSLFVT